MHRILWEAGANKGADLTKFSFGPRRKFLFPMLPGSLVLKPTFAQAAAETCWVLKITGFLEGA